MVKEWAVIMIRQFNLYFGWNDGDLVAKILKKNLN